jgi:hypothetical protein
MKWLLNWWRARQRRIDLEILWPACKNEAPNLDLAREAFIRHALNDPAWLPLKSDEIIRLVFELE